jgi:hypothetical protein
VEATVKVEIPNMVLGWMLDMVQMEVVSYGLDSDGREEEKGPGLKWDATAVGCEAVEGAVGRYGRYTQD